MTLKYAVLSVLVLLCVASAAVAEEAAYQPAGQAIDSPAETSSGQSAGIPASFSAPADFNRSIFRRNKVELAIETGALAYNTPLILDPIFGWKFKRDPSVPNYTLIPTSVLIRWQLYDPRGPWLLRGNTEFAFGAEYDAIPKGPESMYTGPLIGLRYNFIQPNARVVPYFDMRAGLGYTDAAGPWEAKHNLPDIGQGSKFTFTFMLGSGIRYDFNERYSASMAVTFKHISNLYLSEPKYFNHAVNVVGGTVGLNIALNGLIRFLPE